MNFPISEGRRVEGGFAIYPNSILFKAGDYPDRGIAVTPEELKAAADKFAPLEFNSEHDTHGVHKAVLSGIGKHFGGLGGPRRVWVDPTSPDLLRGEVAVPLWLDGELETKSLSMEIDRETKQFTGAGLTYTPRVSEAALMSACVNFALTSEFAMTRHNTPEGQIAMQEMHDMAARAGAVCDRGNVKMASRHESTAVQKIHDLTADHGATCKSGDKPSYMFSENQNSQKEKKPMNALEKIVAFCKGKGMTDEDAAAIIAAAPAQFAAPGMTAAEKADADAVKAKLAAAEETIAKMSASGVKSDAEAFFDAQVSIGRVAPYEKEALVAQFCQAAKDDAATKTTVTFSAYEEGKPAQKTGTRADALKAATLARPVNPLMAEHFADSRPLNASDLHAVFGSQGAETPDEKAARIQKEADAELGKTELGRKALASRNGKN